MLKKIKLLSYAVIYTSLLFSTSLFATAFSWTAGGASTWKTPANWDVGIGFPSTTSDSATFAATAPSVSLFAPAISLNSITHSATGTVTLPPVGGSIVFGGASPSINHLSTATGALSIFIPVTFPAATTTTLNGDNGGFILFLSGAVSAAAPTATLDKTGAGLARLDVSPKTFDGTILVSAGILRTAISTASVSSFVIQGGTLNAIIGSDYTAADVTLSSGTFDIDVTPLTMNSLTYTGGTFTTLAPTDIVNLAEVSGTALTMRNTTISSQIALTGGGGGGVVFDATNDGTATLSGINLGSVVRTFTIANGTASIDMNITGVVSGTAGGLNKMGAGTLELSGAASNTYSGTAAVSVGTLNLNKSGAAIAITEALSISGGVVSLQAAGQIATTSDVSVSGGTLLMNGNTNTFNSLSFTSGAVTTGGATTTLASTGTALTMRDTTLSDPIVLSGASGGSVVFDATNDGTATIMSLDIGSAGVDRTFTIANGTATNDMSIQAGNSLGGGGFVKAGPGRLQLLGTHTYPGATNTVSGGLLAVDGTVTTTQVNIDVGGRIEGIGTLTSDVRVDGTIGPGASIGTLFLVGDITFGTGSTTEVEASSSTADLIDITGSLTIEPGSTILLIPLVPTFPPFFSFPIITTTTGITGSFDTVSSMLPLLSASLTQTANQILLQIVNEDFSGTFTIDQCTKNAENVAEYLDSLDPEDESDLSIVLQVIRDNATNSQEIVDSLDQFQSNFYKGFVTAQETNAFNMDSIFNQRGLIFIQNKCFDRSKFPRGMNLWLDGFYDHIEQGREKCDIGFRTNTGGGAAGLEFKLDDSLLVGFGAGYSYTDINWQRNQADGDIHSAYGSFYTTWYPDPIFINLAALGSYNSYDGDRRIKIFSVHRHAKNSHNGAQGLVRMQLGALLEYLGVQFTPSGTCTYLYSYERGYKEHGANSINLKVETEHYEMLRTEAGFNLSKCKKGKSFNLLFNTEIFYIRESRFHSDRYREKFIGAGPGKFKVKGPYPSRNLIAPGFSITGTGNTSGISFTAEYKGEFYHNFQNHLANFQMDFPF